MSRTRTPRREVSEDWPSAELARVQARYAGSFRRSVEGSSITTSALALSGMTIVSRPGEGSRHGERGNPAFGPGAQDERRFSRPSRILSAETSPDHDELQRAGAVALPVEGRRGPRASAPRRARCAPPPCGDGKGAPADRFAARPLRRRARSVWSCCWRIDPTTRFFSFSSSSEGKTGVRRISTSRSSSRSTSRERAAPRDVHADRVGGVGGKREGRAPALQVFRDLELRAFARPLGQLPRGHGSDEPAAGAERRQIPRGASRRPRRSD